MGQFINIIIGLCGFGLLSCVPLSHAPFIPAPSEPLIISKKNEFQASIGIRPLGTINGDFAYALGNQLAIRCSGSFLLKSNSVSGSLLYFKPLKKLRYYVGPIYTYHYNNLQREPHGIYSTFKAYKYFCIFNSPGLMAGLSLGKKANIKHQFYVKILYNTVTKYQFYRYSESNDLVSQNETLDEIIPNFFSFECSYSLVSQIAAKKNRSWIKMQVGLSFCERTFSHNYLMSGETLHNGYDYSNMPGSTLHPQGEAFFLSLSYIFCSGNTAPEIVAP